MDIYVVRKITCFLNNELIDSFHYDMFHGEAVRNGSVEEDRTYFLEDVPKHSLSLSVNLYRLNEIIEPGLALIVTGHVKAILEEYADLMFLPATLNLVRVIPYREGDFSHWENPEYSDAGDTPLKILKEGADERHLIGKLPTYYEVICANLLRIKPNFEHTRDVLVHFGPLMDDMLIPISDEIMNKYPVLWHQGVFILREDIYARLKDYFHWAYFACVKCSLD